MITNLQPDTAYSVTVAAYTMKGDGARSKPKVVVTKGAGTTRWLHSLWLHEARSSSHDSRGRVGFKMHQVGGPKTGKARARFKSADTADHGVHLCPGHSLYPDTILLICSSAAKWESGFQCPKDTQKMSLCLTLESKSLLRRPS